MLKFAERRGLRRVLAATLAGRDAHGLCRPKRPDDGPGEVRALTSAHTRVVWVQQDGKDPEAVGDALILMGFDSDDSLGERVILDERGTYVKPLITPRGDRIIYSTRPKPGPAEVFIVNWDGSGRRKLGEGFALGLWRSPDDGREWVFAGTEITNWEFNTIWRFPIDAPEARELAWNSAPVSIDNFQVSADGRFAGGMFPWPEAAVADLHDRTLKKLGQGCWPALTTARGLLYWYFDGAHRNLTMVDVDAGGRWIVNVNNAPGFDGAEANHPRWTNHPRFMTLSGPYNLGGPNQARAGGPQTEIWLGRFSDDFARIEGWARVTTNGGGDSLPDAWIDLEQTPHPTRPAGAIGPAHVRAARQDAAAGSRGTPGRQRPAGARRDDPRSGVDPALSQRADRQRIRSHGRRRGDLRDQRDQGRALGHPRRAGGDVGGAAGRRGVHARRRASRRPRRARRRAA